MSDFRSSRLAERNPVTHEQHRREARVQIFLPLIIGAVLILALAVFSTFGQSDALSRWGDISLIWLIRPMLFVGLIALVLLTGLIYVTVRLMQSLPVFARRVQNLFATIGYQVSRMTDKAAAPVIRARSISAGVRRMVRRQTR